MGKAWDGTFVEMNWAEGACREALQRDGWTVIRRGWPDFLAVKGDAVRFIEVKPSRRHHLKPAQYQVALILERVFGVKVERWSPEGEFADGLSPRSKRKLHQGARHGEPTEGGSA